MICPLVACLVPWRAATWAISCAITPASSASALGLQHQAGVDEEEPPAEANALTSSESSTLIVKGTLASEFRAKVPFTIKVVDAEEINAFALPGGFFFVNTGVLLNADSEAELAGVMAHEIAHVAARHGTRQATRGQIINYASIPLIFMGGWTGTRSGRAPGSLSRWAS